MIDVMNEKQSKSAIEAQIEENLRRVYRQKLDEHVPDRFLDLLKALKDQEPDGKSEGSL